MLQLYIFAMLVCFNLAAAEVEIFKPIVESPRLVYTLIPSAPFLSNALQSQFSDTGFITGSSPSQFTNSEYTTKISTPNCDSNALGSGCSISQLFRNAELQKGPIKIQLPREGYVTETSHIQTAFGKEALALPVSSYGIGSVLQPAAINEGSTHKQPVAQGFILQQPVAEAVTIPDPSRASSNTYISSTLQTIGGSTYIQPVTLHRNLQEQPHISDGTNRNFSGAFSLPSNGYASSIGSPILQSITESNTYLQPATRVGSQPVVSAAPNSAIELFVKSLRQALTSSKLLRDFVEFEHQAPGELFHVVGHDILATAGINSPALVEIVAQMGNSIGKLDSQVFLDGQSRTAAKFLDSKGLLSIDVVYDLSQNFVSFVENRANSKVVVDTESLIYAIGLGFFDFIKSFGFDDPYEEVFKLFSEEVKAAHFNAASL